MSASAENGVPPRKIGAMRLPPELQAGLSRSLRKTRSLVTLLTLAVSEMRGSRAASASPTM